jgi:biliverdin reductase
MNVGLIGTGYAAKLRAEALQADSRSTLVAVSGRTLERTQQFGRAYGAIACESWQALVTRADLDLVVVATINRDHGAIARAALEAGKHVVLEYPLALDVAEAEAAIALAKQQNRLLHVEHIELLGGVHQTLKANLPQIGPVFSARYITSKPERPAPRRWSYHLEEFGFPLVGALSRLHRLTDLFGEVATVTCQAQFWTARTDGIPGSSHPSWPDYYITCLCTAHLRFKTGVLAEVTYGKGEALWQAERNFTVQGEKGSLVFEGERGRLIQADGSHSLDVGPRRGLFAQDMALVLDHLSTGSPLYVTPEASLYTLRVADAARRSAAMGETVAIA